MALSLIQLISAGLKMCGLRVEEVFQVMSLLLTEEKQWAMADYLETVIMNPPGYETIYEKAQEISTT